MKNHSHTYRRESTTYKLKQDLKSAQQELQKAKEQIKGNESQIKAMESQVITMGHNMRVLQESAALDHEEALMTVEELKLDNEDLQMDLAISSAKAEIMEKSAVLLSRRDFLKCVSYLKDDNNVKQFNKLLESGEDFTVLTKRLLTLEPATHLESADNSVGDLEVAFGGATLEEQEC